jgi:S-adenosylmethionine:tRNA ribosyltransferase-isomerase
MNTKDFSYDLPPELIATRPAEPRDASRLLHYNRSENSTRHLIFRDILTLLKKGDLLVVNNTKVMPTRLFAGTREVLLLHETSTPKTWQCIGKKLKTGQQFVFGDRLSGIITNELEDGVFEIALTYEGIFEEILDELGGIPLPPYIEEDASVDHKTAYNTVYAKHAGSAAAPTAGLHFTHDLMQKLRDKGVEIVEILLHVGLGTFRPVKVEDVKNHKMHSEWFEIKAEAAKKINTAKANGGRIIAVGTTSMRTLESSHDGNGKIIAQAGDTALFIYPGFEFKVVDGLITNFHLPESTLVMLVSAFIGKQKTLELYNEAVAQKYRFFSYGDATFFI